jgi:hypothetical protein
MFLLFFRNSYFIVHSHSDLEGSCSNLTDQARHTGWFLRVVVGQVI